MFVEVVQMQFQRGRHRTDLQMNGPSRDPRHMFTRMLIQYRDGPIQLKGKIGRAKVVLLCHTRSEAELRPMQSHTARRLVHHIYIGILLGTRGAYYKQQATSSEVDGADKCAWPIGLAKKD